MFKMKKIVNIKNSAKRPAWWLKFAFMAAAQLTTRGAPPKARLHKKKEREKGNLLK